MEKKKLWKNSPSVLTEGNNRPDYLKLSHINNYYESHIKNIPRIKSINSLIIEEINQYVQIRSDHINILFPGGALGSYYITEIYDGIKCDEAKSVTLIVADYNKEALSNLSKNVLLKKNRRNNVKLKVIYIDFDNLVEVEKFMSEREAGFDIIFLFYFLHHLVYAREVLLNFINNLKKGGLIFLKRPVGYLNLVDNNFNHLGELPKGLKKIFGKFFSEKKNNNNIVWEPLFSGTNIDWIISTLRAYSFRLQRKKSFSEGKEYLAEFIRMILNEEAHSPLSWGNIKNSNSSKIDFDKDKYRIEEVLEIYIFKKFKYKKGF